MIRLVLASLATLALTACATTPDAPAGPPDFTPIATTSAPRAALYADCIGQAAASGRYGHAHGGLDLVLFTCDGEPARTFFDALGPWSAAIDSEVAVGDRIIRATTKIERNLFAADYCERQGATHTCVISLRTGEFIVD